MKSASGLGLATLLSDPFAPGRAGGFVLKRILRPSIKVRPPAATQTDLMQH